MCRYFLVIIDGKVYAMGMRFGIIWVQMLKRVVAGCKTTLKIHDIGRIWGGLQSHIAQQRIQHDETEIHYPLIIGGYCTMYKAVRSSLLHNLELTLKSHTIVLLSDLIRFVSCCPIFFPMDLLQVQVRVVQGIYQITWYPFESKGTRVHTFYQIITTSIYYYI